jgi:hypothetical protein
VGAGPGQDDQRLGQVIGAVAAGCGPSQVSRDGAVAARTASTTATVHDTGSSSHRLMASRGERAAHPRHSAAGASRPARCGVGGKGYCRGRADRDRRRGALSASGKASGVYDAARRLGGAFGIAILSAVFTAHAPHPTTWPRPTPLSPYATWPTNRNRTGASARAFQAGPAQPLS